MESNYLHVVFLSKKSAMIYWYKIDRIKIFYSQNSKSNAIGAVATELGEPCSNILGLRPPLSKKSFLVSRVGKKKSVGRSGIFLFS